MTPDKQLKETIAALLKDHLEKKKNQIERGLQIWGITQPIERLTKNNRLQVQLTDSGAKRIETYYLDNDLFLSIVEDKAPKLTDGKFNIELNVEYYERPVFDVTQN